MSLEPAVALFVYNRPDTTAAVFEQIRAAQPETLFIVADGPRPDAQEDEKRCRAVRTVVEDIDWECEVHRRYREQNLGLPRSVYEGLDWVFEHVPEAIILEDDTVPHPDFFQFCEALLECYRDERRVMAINGTNRLGSWKPARSDYHFITYQGVWGWATWRDAWRTYDPAMKDWEDDAVRDRIRRHLGDAERYRYYQRRFQRSYEGLSPSWSRMWRFAVLASEGLCCVPARNLVTNIGFDERAVHTTDPDAALAALPSSGLSVPLTHPQCIVPDREYERTCYERFRRPSMLERIVRWHTPERVRRHVPEQLGRLIRSRE